MEDFTIDEINFGLQSETFNTYLNEHIKQCFVGVFDSLRLFLIYSFCGAFSQRLIYIVCGKLL